jgi:hypothetical protein
MVINKMTNDEKISSLEYFTMGLYSPYQWVDSGFIDYIKMLRRGENIQFLDKFKTHDELLQFSFKLRDMLQSKDIGAILDPVIVKINMEENK